MPETIHQELTRLRKQEIIWKKVCAFERERWLKAGLYFLPHKAVSPFQEFLMSIEELYDKPKVMEKRK